jgi:hypothetical protein
MIFLTEEDFKDGIYKIPMNKDLCNEQLVSYIDKYEIEITQDLLGCELSKEFIDDYNDTAGIMNSTSFQNIFNPICEDLKTISFNTYHNDSYFNNDYFNKTNKSCNNILRNSGFLEVLKGFIFFYYMRDFNHNRTLTGVINLNSENSNTSKYSEWGLHTIYNNTVKDYKTIQEYICLHKNDYEIYLKFNGIDKKPISWF